MTTDRSMLQTTAQCCGNFLQSCAAAAALATAFLKKKETERARENLILLIFWKVFLPCTRLSKAEGFHWSNIPHSMSTGRSSSCTKLSDTACQFCCQIRLLQTWYSNYTNVSRQITELSFWYILKIYYFSSSSTLQHKDMTIFNLSHHTDEQDKNDKWNFFVT